ncbi:MAG TPA: hypothetical protein VF434_05085 [Promineifilum sp.]
MAQKQTKSAALPGVFATLGNGFELTTRYLWLIVIPAILDVFLWIGPRLSFRPLIESLSAQLPPQPMLVDVMPLLEMFATRLNHFTYLSVSLLGVPALMTGLSPERTPIQPIIIERSGWGEWFGFAALFTLGGLLLAAVYFCLIAYALRRSGPAAGVAAPFSAARFIARAARTWLRLAGLAVLLLILVIVIVFPVAIVAGFASLLSQAIGTFVAFGGVILLIWLLMFFSYTPQGLTLNPRKFLPALGESVLIFRNNLPQSLNLLIVVILVRRILGFILLSVDVGTWLTGINLLAHAYINTAVLMAMFIFYRDRYVSYLQGMQAQAVTEPVKN